MRIFSEKRASIEQLPYTPNSKQNGMILGRDDDQNMHFTLVNFWGLQVFLHIDKKVVNFMYNFCKTCVMEARNKRLRLRLRVRVRVGC